MLRKARRTLSGKGIPKNRQSIGLPRAADRADDAGAVPGIRQIDIAECQLTERRDSRKRKRGID
jgi:hypothetical protein